MFQLRVLFFVAFMGAVVVAQLDAEQLEQDVQASEVGEVRTFFGKEGLGRSLRAAVTTNTVGIGSRKTGK